MALRAYVEARPTGAAADPDAAVQEARALLREGLQGAQIVLRGKVTELTPEDTRNTRRSIQAGRIEQRGDTLEGPVGSPEPQIRSLELGWKSKSGKRPPYRALLPWVEQNLGIPRDQGGVGVAIAISKSIGKRGFSSSNPKPFAPGPGGAHMFERGVAAAQPEIDRVFEGTAERIVAVFNGRFSGAPA